MRTKLINESEEYSQGFGAGDGTIERSEYECPCGKGKIIEVNDNIPGFRDRDAFIQCTECSKKYDLDFSKGVGAWELVEKKS